MVEAAIMQIRVFCDEQRIGVRYPIRAHPRTSSLLISKLQALVCQERLIHELLAVTVEPSGVGASNGVLLQMADCVMSHTSSMLTECVVLRTPAAFVTSGWDGTDAFLSKCFGGACEVIPRLSGTEQVACFLSSLKRDGGDHWIETFSKVQLGGCEGHSPLLASWEQIVDLNQ